MAASKPAPRTRLFLQAGSLLGAGLLLWAFPPFHLVKTSRAAGGTGTGIVTGTVAPKAAGGFDAVAEAARLWSGDIPAGLSKAAELQQVAQAMKADPLKARADFGVQSGLGARYYFVRGTGRVVSREGSRVRVALDEAGTQLVELRLGPVFGNTVRDGCGLLNVNSFPGLQEFNALSGELNALVERQVLPSLREKAVVGAILSFTACAEAPETLPAAGAPLLTLIPLKADLR